MISAIADNWLADAAATSWDAAPASRAISAITLTEADTSSMPADSCSASYQCYIYHMIIQMNIVEEESPASPIFRDLGHFFCGWSSSAA